MYIYIIAFYSYFNLYKWGGKLCCKLWDLGCPHFQITPCDGKPTSLVVKPEMFVDEPHVKAGENYTPSTVHFNMVGPKGENKQTTPIWLDISRHIFGFDSFDSQHSIEAKKHRWCLLCRWTRRAAWRIAVGRVCRRWWRIRGNSSWRSRRT